MRKFILSVLFLGVSVFAKEQITVYTYHNHAPFITGNNQGLTHKLVNYLNKNAKDEYVFKVKVVPRSRLNYILKPWIQKKCEEKKCNEKWILLWVNHKWGFGSDSLENFSWIELLKDSNAIISSKLNKFEYTKPEDLIGKKFAGISGHKYLGIDDLVKDGKINRINGKSEYDNLEVTLSNRVDATLLPKSAFDYYVKLNDEFKDLYVSKIAHQEYMRYIMTNSKNAEVFEYLKTLDFGNIK